MKTKPCQFRLIAIIGITLVFSVGCEKDQKSDFGNGISYGSLADIDGNLYSTVKFGSQEWMAGNLKVTKYNDGREIVTGLPTGEWFEARDGAYAIFPFENIDGLESSGEVVEAYGLHYNWYAVESGNLCPAGWRVPEPSDWEGLLWYLIDNHDHINLENVGESLKSCRQADSALGGECNTSEHPHWLPDGIDYFAREMDQRYGWEDFRPGPEHNLQPLAGTNEFGFSALPAGVYIPGFHHGQGYMSIFWVDHKTVQDIPVTNEEGEEVTITVETVWHHDINFGPYTSAMSNIGRGLPVRCVRGEPESRKPTFREP